MGKDKRTRGVPYLDSIDLEILEFLGGTNWDKKDLVGHSVLDIANHLKLNHNNLKPHIDKLLHLELITIYPKPIVDEHMTAQLDSKGNIKYKYLLASRKVANLYWQEMIYTGGDEEAETYDECVKQNLLYDTIFDCLKKVKAYFYDIEAKKQINFDLRKATTQARLLNMNVGTLSDKSDNLIKMKKKEIKTIIKRSRKQK